MVRAVPRRKMASLALPCLMRPNMASMLRISLSTRSCFTTAHTMISGGFFLLRLSGRTACAFDALAALGGFNRNDAGAEGSSAPVAAPPLSSAAREASLATGGESDDGGNGCCGA